jgi:hypothetical protein
MNVFGHGICAVESHMYLVNIDMNGCSPIVRLVHHVCN